MENVLALVKALRLGLKGSRLECRKGLSLGSGRGLGKGFRLECGKVVRKRDRIRLGFGKRV